MVSMGPYSKGNDFTHMYDKPDLNAPIAGYSYKKGSILGYILQRPEFSNFAHIIFTAKLESLFDDIQSNLTLFIPHNDLIRNLTYNEIMNLDLMTARNIVEFSCMNRRITSDLLSNSPIAYFVTRNSTNKILVETVRGQTYLNGCAKLLEANIKMNNGVIHIINNVLIPSSTTTNI